MTFLEGLFSRFGGVHASFPWEKACGQGSQRSHRWLFSFAAGLHSPSSLFSPWLPGFSFTGAAPRVHRRRWRGFSFPLFTDADRRLWSNFSSVCRVSPGRTGFVHVFCGRHGSLHCHCRCLGHLCCAPVPRMDGGRMSRSPFRALKSMGHTPRSLKGHLLRQRPRVVPLVAGSGLMAALRRLVQAPLRCAPGLW